MVKQSSEERHNKQKEKLLSSGKEEKTVFVESKSLKQEACEEANKAGYECVINSNSVLMFSFTEENRVNEATEWLMKHYGVMEEIRDSMDKSGNKKIEVKRIPFSFGFAKTNISKNDHT